MLLKAEDVDRIVVHCSATKAHQNIGAREIRRWHEGRGWRDIGYHRIIRRAPEDPGGHLVEGGRPLNQVGAHAYGYNKTSLGICLVGGLDELGKAEDNFTDEQFELLEGELRRILNRYPNITDICGHRDLSPDIDGDGVIEKWEWTKDCPCFDVRAWCEARGIVIQEAAA